MTIFSAQELERIRQTALRQQIAQQVKPVEQSELPKAA